MRKVMKSRLFNFERPLSLCTCRVASATLQGHLPPYSHTAHRKFVMPLLVRCIHYADFFIIHTLNTVPTQSVWNFEETFRVRYVCSGRHFRNKRKDIEQISFQAVRGDEEDMLRKTERVHCQIGDITHTKKNVQRIAQHTDVSACSSRNVPQIRSTNSTTQIVKQNWVYDLVTFEKYMLGNSNPHSCVQG